MIRRLLPPCAAASAVVAVLAAAGWDAVAGTETDDAWRDWLGRLGWISIVAALAAVALAVLALATSAGRSRLVVGGGAAVLGLVTLVYWMWVLDGILETT